MTKSKAGNTLGTNDITLLVGITAIIVLFNIITHNLFFRIDLTSEKRYTLSQDTKQILRNLDDIVYIRVYLEGDLNIPFRKFQDNIYDMLDEFKVYGKSNLQYEFINPFEDESQQMQQKIIGQLYEKGLKPTNIHQRDREGAVTEKIVFPAALISYKNIEVPLNLLLNNPGAGADQNLNNSIESLEYNFISTIKNITAKQTEKIAFIEGHGELNEMEVNDISHELSKSYQIDRGIIHGSPGILDEYKAIVIAKPVSQFSEQDKFVIDQYIMKGGKALWLLDAVQVSLDSLVSGETMAFISELNLNDMLFRYGVRINPVLVQDIQCNVIPINMALRGNPVNFQPVPWLYYPLISPSENHPVTRNLNMIYCRFANTIDTIEARKTIRKTPLLSTSQMSATKKVPALISLEEVQQTPQKKNFTDSHSLVGVLLEGSFESVFKNRGLGQYFRDPPKIKEQGKATKIAVVADGDIIRNDIRYSSQGPSIQPLGYDRFTRQTFGNKDFLVNLIQYLADDKNLLDLRGREFKIRLLDKEKLSSERSKWILINMILPSLLVMLFGFLFHFIRRHRFSVS
ncbi:MAG: gliding motility-associated ABC transporter substrate-binding protein GldG [Bacteroidales bacterium]|nr:gliding motility-associated ABC transporter substrate-binding protein GldG [Bacteroidales bacterium]